MRESDDFKEVIRTWGFVDDAKAIADLIDVICRSWKVATEWDGHPVWKKETMFTAEGGLPESVYIWVRQHDGGVLGWAWTRGFMDEGDGRQMGYSKLGGPDTLFPTDVHVPMYSSKKASPSLVT